MDKIASRNYAAAKKEGRICERCGWMITKKGWKAGYKLCPGCYDALKGVNVNWGYTQYQQEKPDFTGEMA